MSHITSGACPNAPACWWCRTCRPCPALPAAAISKGPLPVRAVGNAAAVWGGRLHVSGALPMATQCGTDKVGLHWWWVGWGWWEVGGGACTPQPVPHHAPVTPQTVPHHAGCGSDYQKWLRTLERQLFCDAVSFVLAQAVLGADRSLCGRQRVCQ